ncbi:MAG: MBL fold metallo-hydrolase [Ignavibacteriaceae bacterium]
MQIKFWGTRGSIPVPGKNTLKYGGNTPCVELRTDDDKIIIFDAGSGIRELGIKLAQKSTIDEDINILISHYHWDHIQGIPFFLPLYEKKRKVIFHGLTTNGRNITDILSDQMNYNYFPIKIDEVNADVHYKQIDFNSSYNINGIKIETFKANHSTPTLAFKIFDGDKKFVYMTDNELNFDNNGHSQTLEELNKELIEICRGCDYLIHDTMYDETQLLNKKGWGHSSNILLANFSILAEVKNLVLFHYNPDYTDDKIEYMLSETKNIFEKENHKIGCVAAEEGLEIRL